MKKKKVVKMFNSFRAPRLHHHHCVCRCCWCYKIKLNDILPHKKFSTRKKVHTPVFADE